MRSIYMSSVCRGLAFFKQHGSLKVRRQRLLAFEREPMQDSIFLAGAQWLEQRGALGFPVPEGIPRLHGRICFGSL